MENQPTIILKISFFNQIKSFWVFLFSICLLVVFILFTSRIGLFNDDNLDLTSIVIFAVLGAFYLYMTLPTLFLHLNYLKRNRNEEYEIGNQTIIRRKKGVVTIYNREDIDHIYLYRSVEARVAWNNYHFIKIVMKSGEKLYLTSLLYPSGLEKILKKHIKVFYYNVKHYFVYT